LVGRKPVRQEGLFSPVRRETRVSRELRYLRELVDFGWFREAVKEKFSEDNGRPSIAPETLGAMMLLGYWFNITSDRELCEECEDRLSFREFIGISDDELVPVHSSLTHWRQRLGREVFREFINKSIEAAVGVGLAPGRCRMFDSSLVKSQADANGRATVELDPIAQTNDYLDALGDWEDVEIVEEAEEEPGRKRGSGWRKQEHKRKLRTGAKIKVNSHDVEAKLLSHPGKRTDFYHKCHFEFDASSGLVMNADAEHAPDAPKMVRFLRDEKRPVDTVCGDTGYFTGESEAWLSERGIVSMISARENYNDGGRVFGLDAFEYVEDRDEYICPGGEVLRRSGTTPKGEARYRTRSGACACCEFQAYCFRAGKLRDQRELKVGSHRKLVVEALRRNRSHRYRRLKVKRSIVCEGSFATMKCYGGLGRARGLGEESMAIQAMLAGAVHNLKKALKFVGKRKAQAQEAVLTRLTPVRRRLGQILSLMSGNGLLDTQITAA
jgi:IS5 family transposase